MPTDGRRRREMHFRRGRTPSKSWMHHRWRKCHARWTDPERATRMHREAGAPPWPPQGCRGRMDTEASARRQARPASSNPAPPGSSAAPRRTRSLRCPLSHQPGCLRRRERAPTGPGMPATLASRRRSRWRQTCPGGRRRGPVSWHSIGPRTRGPSTWPRSLALATPTIRRLAPRRRGTRHLAIAAKRARRRVPRGRRHTETTWIRHQRWTRR